MILPRASVGNIREVFLHVKRARVHVTSDSGAQILYMSRSCTLLGFATRRDMRSDKQAHRYQQMTRQQAIKHIRKQSERTLPNEILAQGREDYGLQLAVIFFVSYCFHLSLRCSRSDISWTYWLHVKIATCDVWPPVNNATAYTYFDDVYMYTFTFYV